MDDSSSLQEAQRRRLVAAAVSLTANTPLAPKRYERQLLARYQTGDLTIEEVMDLLDTSTYHVLYRSRATHALTAADLQALLDWSRTYNAQHQVTGLLLYSDGRFVQLIEGAAVEVQALFARIQQDLRHTQVVTVSDGPGPHRWFADWQLALGNVSAAELDHTLQVVERHSPVLMPVEDAHVQTLLHAFSLPDVVL